MDPKQNDQTANQDGQQSSPDVITPDTSTNSQQAQSPASTAPGTKISVSEPADTSESQPTAATGGASPQGATPQPEVTDAPSPGVSGPETTSAEPTPSTIGSSADQSPQPNTPGATPQVAGIPAMQGSKTPKNKKKLLLFIAAPILAILTLVGVYLALQVFSGGVALTDYEGDKFSIKYPEGYEEKERSGLIYFQEPLENPDATGPELEELEKTQSGVIVGIQEIPSSLSEEQRALIRENYEKAGTSFAEDIAQDEQDVTNQQVDDSAELAGMPAKLITAEINEDGKKIADVRFVFALDDERLVVVAVLAHVGDSGVEKKAQAIIDSFKLAE